MQTPIPSRPAIPIGDVDPETQGGSQRWAQLAIGVVCMMAISSPQYGGPSRNRSLSVTGGTFRSPDPHRPAFSYAPVQGLLVEKFVPSGRLPAI
jgi:hypothetical protein